MAFFLLAVYLLLDPRDSGKMSWKRKTYNTVTIHLIDPSHFPGLFTCVIHTYAHATTTSTATAAAKKIDRIKLNETRELNIVCWANRQSSDFPKRYQQWHFVEIGDPRTHAAAAAHFLFLVRERVSIHWIQFTPFHSTFTLSQWKKAYKETLPYQPYIFTFNRIHSLCNEKPTFEWK